MKIVNSHKQYRFSKISDLLKVLSYGKPRVRLQPLSFLSLTANAQVEEDPLSPKPNLMWLSDDVNVSIFGDGEYDSFLGKSEIWTNNWGVSAKLLQNDNNDVFGLPKDSKYFNFDVKRRLFGSREKSNLELGLGWQELDIDSQLEASGPKVSVSGRYNVFSSFQVYGLSSYFPELEDDVKNADS